MICHDITVAHSFVDQMKIAPLSVSGVSSSMIANFAITKIASITEKARSIGRIMTMKEQIEIITYEQDRLNYFTDLMKKAQNRYKRLFKKFKDAPMLSAEDQLLSDAGRETHFLGDVVEILEGKQSAWISVEDRLPDREGTYLVCTFKGARKFGVYGRYCVCDEPQFEYDVTHWMPLPEPPKMKGE